MQIIELKFLEVHTPLFIAGRNFGNKIDIAKVPGVRIFWLRDIKEIHVVYGKEVGIVEGGNTSVKLPVNPKDLGYDLPLQDKPIAIQAPSTTTTQARGKIKAQISDPTRDLVFGPGN